MNAVYDKTFLQKLRDKNPSTVAEAVKDSNRFAVNKELESEREI